ncbi:MAG: YggW family oxidoreductase [Cycloclasticus sp. symbiont of Bathymodiolus heckerae]|nr:MAG: YggW family oxidoreductase [Cycloclasticus sp. symbiont of Bathymodiolus heckerae]
MSPIITDYSLYIHVPWCIKKCPYCDFNSHEKRSDYDEDGYVNALIKDLTTEAANVKGRTLKSIFIGGGTPSLFSADSINRILTAVDDHIDLSNTTEITLEANPGTAESEKFHSFRNIGINRLSIGIQSFNDTHLQKLGRVHNSDQAHRAISMAKEAGFERINLDLMFGLPEQTIEQACLDVKTALEYKTGHLSHYQLTLEKNTLFHKHPPALPQDDMIWEMQTASQKLIAEQLIQYEVSAYSATNQQSQHNINYWQFGDYMGIGAGAHGKITQQDGTISRYWKNKLPREYIRNSGTPSIRGGEHIVKTAELPFEFMMNALRLKSGFTIAQYHQRTRQDPILIQTTLDTLIKKGLLTQHASIYRCTEQGWNFLNNTLEHFIS